MSNPPTHRVTACRALLAFESIIILIIYIIVVVLVVDMIMLVLNLQRLLKLVEVVHYNIQKIVQYAAKTKRFLLPENSDESGVT